MEQRDKEKETMKCSQEKNVIMEHVPEIKQSMESNLAGEGLQNESCHPNLACSASCGNGGGWGNPVWMEARWEENKTKYFVYRSFLREIKPLPTPTTGTCIFLMSAA